MGYLSYIYTKNPRIIETWLMMVKSKFPLKQDPHRLVPKSYVSGKLSETFAIGQ